MRDLQRRAVSVIMNSVDSRDERERRTIVIDGKRIVLRRFDTWRGWERLIPVLGRQAVLRAKRQCDREIREFSDAFWLREVGTIPGAHIGRKPSAAAVRLSRIRPRGG